MQTTFKRSIIIGFGLSLLILILSSTASFVSIQNLLSSSRMVDHTHQVIAELEDINTMLVEAETDQRGYLLTGDPGFLTPFNELPRQIESNVESVKKLTADNPVQQQNVEVLKGHIDKRIGFLERGIRLRKDNQQIGSELLITGKQHMDAAREMTKSMEDIEQNLLNQRTRSMQRFSNYTPILIVIAAILSLIITIVFYIRIISDFKRRSQLQHELEQKDRETSNRIAIIQNIADKVSGGNYKTRVDDAGKDLLGSLSSSLNKMAESLDYSFGMLSDKEWLQAGIAGLNQEMMGEKDVESLGNNIIDFVAGYTNSQVGALYLMNDYNMLQLTSGFALASDTKKVVAMGEGIVGQCALNGREITIGKVPAENFLISFASGEVMPSFVIAIPVFHDGGVKGVIELGSLDEYSNNSLLFLKAVSEQTGIVINSAQSRKKLQELLEETQSQSEELQVQHNELENINEELKSQSEKLQVSEEELKVQQEELMQTNQELEERTTMLEEKNQMIEERNQEIQIKARELATSTRYKSEFLANMSHELRTPLNSILLLSRLMAENNEQNLSEDQMEYARVIQSSGHGLLSLIDEILDLSKIESGKMDIEFAMESVDSILDDLRSLFAPVAADKKLELRIEKDADVPARIETDKIRLEQIIKNLLSNALKFTAAGYVGLTVSKHPSDPSRICFVVKDTGIGIAGDKQKLIFEAFQQADGSTRRQYGGTGLGLSISRELTRLLGGEITLSSEPGQGSEFRLLIPITSSAYLRNQQINERPEQALLSGVKEEQPKYTGEPIPPSIPDDRDSIGHNDKTILIIEDDTNFAKVLLEFARKRGYKGIVAVRGDEGIELALSVRPLGILLDIKLPVKDGWDVIKELKANPKTRQIPVHIMSSNEVRNKSLSSGAVDFINKPLALDKMHEIFLRIEDVLNHEPRKVLIVEENAKHARALSYFLEGFNVVSEIKSEVKDGIESLMKKEVNCVILDMGINKQKSYTALEEIKRTPGLEKLPIIIFTGKNLSRAEEVRIKQFADSIIIKTAHSYQRMLDEVSLFLHLVEENKVGKSNGNTFKKLGNLSEILKDKKVLIADDDVRNIFSLSKALENFGMTVLSAMDGKEALTQLKENPSVDVILMDMMMPEMDGYETMQLIRKMPEYSRLPIIAVTAKAMAGDREKCIVSGASDYITKPVDTDQLLSLLRVWLYDTSTR